MVKSLAARIQEFAREDSELADCYREQMWFYENVYNAQSDRLRKTGSESAHVLVNEAWCKVYRYHELAMFHQMLAAKLYANARVTADQGI